MKKTSFNRLMAIVLAVLLLIGIFTGCKNQEMPEELGGKSQTTETAQTTEATTEETEIEVAETTEEVAETTEEVAETTEQVTETTEEEEKGYFIPFVEVIDDVIYVDVEYFLERATITFADGTAALHAITEGTSVVLDDVHAIAERGQHRDNTMMLPVKGGNVAVTYDGTTAIAAALHSHKGEWALCKSEGLETGYELVEKPKDKTEGEWLSISAVCVENKEAEFGYDFYVLVNEECVPKMMYTPVYTPQQPKPEEKPEEQPEVEEPTEEPEKPVRPGGGGGQKPDDEDEDEPAHNPEHNEPEYDDDAQEGEGNTTPGHGDVVYDPDNQDEIPDLTGNPSEGHNDTAVDNGGHVEAGQEKIPDLTSNPTDGRNDVTSGNVTSSNTSTSNSTVTITHSNSNSNAGNGTSAAHNAPAHGGQVFD